MIDRIRYYFDLLATLCGFDSPEKISTFGVVFVAMATGVLIYACYRAVLLTIWPGERDMNHIKRQVLDDEEVTDAY